MIQPILPEIIIIITSLAGLLIGSYKKNSSILIVKISIYALIIASYYLILQLLSKNGFEHPHFIIDSFSSFGKILIVFASIAVLTMMLYRLERGEKIRFEMPILMLLSIVGMMVMVSATDLIPLYLGIELLSLPLYILASFNRNDSRQSEAGLKYFMLGAVSSGILLYGASLIYGFSGTTYLDGDINDSNLTIGLLVGVIMFIIGLFFKISAVPFHMWTPDIYHGASKITVSFFATAPKIAAIIVLYRFLNDFFFVAKIQWEQIIIFVSIASMIVGAVAGLAQKNIKRLMAYSSIGHIGFLLIGVVVGGNSGLQGFLSYLSIYLFMALAAFSLILVMRKNGRSCEKISDLSGISKSNPIIALCFAITMFSMAGIPPLAGFFAKFYVLKAAVSAELYIYSMVAVIFSVISAFYYLRIIKTIYFDNLTTPLDRVENNKIRLLILVTTALNLLFFLYPSILLDPINLVVH